MFSEGDVCSKLVKLRGLLELDGDFGIDFLSVFSLDVLLLDGGDGGVSVFGEDLCHFEGEGDALAHGFEVDVPVLFEDELGEEQGLVESARLTNPVDVVLVELDGLAHCFEQKN